MPTVRALPIRTCFPLLLAFVAGPPLGAQAPDLNGRRTAAQVPDQHGPPPDAQNFALVFMEPVEGSASDLPVHRRVDDPDRLAEFTRWTDNDYARWAVALYRSAAEIARRRGGADLPDALHVALVPGGNHADAGFSLLSRDGMRDYPGIPYVKLGADAWRFETTILHETGHVVLRAFRQGASVPTEPIASIPHTTSALTDRGTAFNEGYAIHLETLLAHLSDESSVRARYRHERLLFGAPPGFLAEYYRPASDLRTYAQSLARYTEVRDNAWAFASAFQEPDYLRVQLDRARDFSTLRDANQLLQSEGFYATFFFSLLARGNARPSADEVRARQERVLVALAEMLVDAELDPDTPHLLQFLETYRRLFRDEAAEVLDVFLDLSHGVFVDPEAGAVWKELYRAALRLDMEGLDREAIEATRRGWREHVEADPAVLRSRLGPQIPCLAPAAEVLLVAFGASAPLAFDANTVQEGVLRSVPGITGLEVERWLAERVRGAFSGVEDVWRRVPLSGAVREGLECGDPDPAR